MKLLVTGCAGFIGTNFVYYYLRKHKDSLIVGLDKLTYAGNLENLSKLDEDSRKRFVFVKGDIINSELVNHLFTLYDFDVVVNFAAESHVDRSIFDPHIFIQTNVLGVQSLLSVAMDHWRVGERWKGNKLFVQVSTDEVYGSLGPEGYFTETTPLDPHSPYSASKAGGDLIAKSYYDTFGMPVVITRCSNNYGPYQFPEKLIPLMIWNCLNHKELPVYGDGKNIRDWLYVEDHCIAIDLVIQKGRIGEVYNIGGHNERENIYVVKKIIEILRKKTSDDRINESLIKFVKDRPGHDRRYAMDPTKIMNELGWKHTLSFEEGLEITIDWYLNNLDWVRNVISGEYLKFYEKNYTNR
ncbi:MAG: dTDP-glucose 4,6-dehydratase [Spirochaetia bacterium]|nr:dTDP-glucose 4,6-dehydratase [Spirochaetota bacterium]MCX8097255.1 dTDP-glucose 4,6-dehydratase [Spirochaetota bacterium]MDW8111863.1 dTDP-glucose 4,6-dehydratase [Spirochaetia bacterium]